MPTPLVATIDENISWSILPMFFFPFLSLLDIKVCASLANPQIVLVVKLTVDWFIKFADLCKTCQDSSNTSSPVISCTSLLDIEVRIVQINTPPFPPRMRNSVADLFLNSNLRTLVAERYMQGRGNSFTLIIYLYRVCCHFILI